MAIAAIYAYKYTLIYDQQGNFRVLSSGEHGVGKNPSVKFDGHTLTLSRVQPGIALSKNLRPYQQLSFDLSPIACLLTVNTALKLQDEPGRRSIELVRGGATSLHVGELTHQSVFPLKVDYQVGTVECMGRELRAGSRSWIAGYQIFVESVVGAVLGHGYRVNGWLRNEQVPVSATRLSAGHIREW